jgi:predicted amidohydrolase YtcJ
METTGPTDRTGSRHRRLALVGGTVLTCDGSGTTAGAVGVKDQRIAAVGDAGRVRAALGPDHVEIDLGGRTLVPGLIDAHNHMVATAESFAALDARGVRSIADLGRALERVVERTRPGQWVRGFGLNWARLAEGRLPTRADLDRITVAHPVVLVHVSGHYVLVNSRALGERGIGDQVADPPGGTVERDAAGRPTGILRDAATNLVLQQSVDIGRHGPNFHMAVPLEDLVAMLAEANRRYLAAGLTTICDPQVTRRELEAYREARRQGVVDLRVVAMPLSHQLDELLRVGLVGPFGDDHLRIGALKLYTDGAITGGTAVFEKPLGRAGNQTGTLYHAPAELASLIRRAHDAGWQLGIHTMGDRAIGIMLDAVEAAMRARPRPDVRHRIEHCTWPTAEQLRRIAALGMIPVTQPGSITELGDVWLDQLGSRIHGAMPLRAARELGIRPVISSDAFVQSYRPLDTIAAAVRRITPSGLRVGPEHELTVEEALRAHTVDAARALVLDDRLGSVEVGKLADLVVLDGDLRAASPEGLRALDVWMTVVDGRIVYRRDGVAATGAGGETAGLQAGRRTADSESRA